MIYVVCVGNTMLSLVLLFISLDSWRKKGFAERSSATAWASSERRDECELQNMRERDAALRLIARHITDPKTGLKFTARRASEEARLAVAMELERARCRSMAAFEDLTSEHDGD